MANLESNDIDDLFKRASDKYPLRTDSADWDKLAAAMEKDPSLIVPSSAAEEGDRRRRRRFLWLFLLLPLGGLVYYIGQTTGRSTARTISAAHVPSSQPATAPAPAGSTAGVPAQTGSTSGAPASTGAGSTAVVPENAGPATVAPPNAVKVTPGKSSAGTSTHGQPGSAQPNADTRAPGQPGSARSNAGTRTPDQFGSAAKGSAQEITVPAGSTNKTLVKAPAGPLSGARTSGKALSGAPGQRSPTAGTPALPGAGTAAIVPANAGRGQKVGDQQEAKKTGSVSGSTHPKHPSLRNSSYTDPTNEIASTSGLTVNSNRSNIERDATFSGLNFQRAPITNRVALNINVKANNPTVAAKDSSSKKNIARNKNDKKLSHFYVGLLGAPDLSTVKMQSVKGVGTTFGILLGYNINQKWAIETGAYLDHKKYYTEGEYFKGYSNPTAKLLNVDGACNMWEIPVNVRYNLSAGEKTKWFTTAGLSTYLMTKQSYISMYEANGTTWPSPWGSSKPSQYWFSIINLSVGYEQKLGKIGNLRLEPYLRIPLSGMGSGSLPIMSAGLNIGITRKLW